MRSYLPSFELRRVSSLEDALTAMAGEPGRWRPFAGGTDLMVMLEMGTLRHQQFVNLWSIPELHRIESNPATVSIGALVTYTDLLEDPVIRSDFPLLCEAASQTGGVATQNRGTVGVLARAQPRPTIWPEDHDASLRDHDRVRADHHGRARAGIQSRRRHGAARISRIG